MVAAVETTPAYIKLLLPFVDQPSPPPMQITIKLFARAKDLAGVGSFPLELPAECRVGQAKAALIARYPELAPLVPILLIAVNGNYATDETALTESCELACFPPVSGG